MVCKRQKVYDSWHKFPKERPGSVSRVRIGSAHGYQVEDYEEEVHGMLELLWRLQGLVAAATEGKAQGNEDSMRALRVADGHLPLFKQTEMDQAVLQF